MLDLLHRLSRRVRVGEEAGDAYLNAAAVLSTSMEPSRLLETTKEVEIELGRPSNHATWTPRTVDLDLVTCGDLVLADDRLRVPHPGCWYRRFVLDPLCRIAPTTKHPILNHTFEERVIAFTNSIFRKIIPIFPISIWFITTFFTHNSI